MQILQNVIPKRKCPVHSKVILSNSYPVSDTVTLTKGCTTKRMKKIILNAREQHKYEVIRKLIETNGNKKAAAVKLNCSLKTVDRLIRVYEESGKEGFIHGNRGKPPAVKKDEDLKKKVIDLYSLEYTDANITHFTQIINKDLNCSLSSETVRLWLIEEKILSPKAHRKTKKKLKKRLQEELKNAKLPKREKNELKKKIETLDNRSLHPRRERSKYFGEMVQMDASEYCWIKGEKWTLHLAVDDATGRVLGAYMDRQETLKGYYHVLKQILMDYGIPALFYTDRRTVFEYRKKNRLMDDEDTFTQFSYACHKLGIEIKTTSVPQAKGRIERLNGSFQSRLPVELRRANVASIEEANVFLKSYLEEYNRLFSLQLHTNRTVFSKQSNERQINDILSVLTVRTIDHGHTIHYKNKVYVPAHKSGNPIYLQEGMKVIMAETLDGRLMINVFEDLFYARQIKPHEDISREFDYTKEESFTPFKWTLPRKRSWRTDDFLGFLAKQKHRQK